MRMMRNLESRHHTPEKVLKPCITSYTEPIAGNPEKYPFRPVSLLFKEFYPGRRTGRRQIFSLMPL
jgi:hypothetical protein